MKMKTAEEIAAFLQPLAASCGAEIYEVVFKQGKNPSLTVFIDSDKEGGVDILDCEAISRKLSDLLDEADPIEGSYTLEVGSAGAERTRPDVRAAVHAQREQSGIGQTFQKRQGFL